MAEEKKGFGGLGKMGGKAPEAKRQDVSKPEGHQDGHEEHQEGGKMTTITHHPDGTHTMEHDGETSDHPHHLHLAAHLGHKLSGGDAHHLTHHDGMEAHSHTVHESGEHEDHQGDPHESLDAMMGGQMGGDMESQHEDELQEAHPTFGGM